LVFIGICLKHLFSKIEFVYDEDDISRLVPLLSEQEYIDALWDDCVKYADLYVPILITDDSYSEHDYSKLIDICEINWSLVFDIGNNELFVKNGHLELTDI